MCLKFIVDYKKSVHFAIVNFLIPQQRLLTEEMVVNVKYIDIEE